MQPVYLHDKSEIETFLRGDPFLHLYELGDLDDFFWPYTSWIASRQDGVIKALLLLYSGGGLPVLLANVREDPCLVIELLKDSALAPLLPRRFYSHLGVGLADTLCSAGYSLEFHGHFHKMALVDPGKIETCLGQNKAAYPLRRLAPADAPVLARMYDEAYPGNWFDVRMLETGVYYGAWDGERIISAAGVHVYSPRYRAAALGNICTRPEYRGAGLGSQVTASVCRALLADGVDRVGLNVRAGNEAALAVYTRLGFAICADYEEYMVG